MLKLIFKSSLQSIVLGCVVIGWSNVDKSAHANGLSPAPVESASAQQRLSNEIPLVKTSSLDDYLSEQLDVYSDSFLLTEFNYESFCSSNPKHNICADYEPGDIEKETESSPPDGSSVTQEEMPMEVTKEEPSNLSFSGWAINPEVSTMGLGGSIVKSISPNFNVRLGGYGFSFGTDYEDTQVKYDGDLGLLNIPALLDWFPWEESGFRVSTGAVFYDNGIKANGVPKDNGTFVINDVTYSTQELTSLSSNISWGSSVAPYIGIGWGNPVKKGQHWNFSINLGAFFPGSPDVSVTPTYGNIPQSLQNEISANVEVERQELEDSIKWLNVYPVLSVGFSYQF